MDNSNPGNPGNPGNPEIRVLERVVFGLFNKARTKNRNILCMVGRAAYKIEPEGSGVRLTKIDGKGMHQISLESPETVGLGANLDGFVGAASDLETAAVMEPREWKVLYGSN